MAVATGMTNICISTTGVTVKETMRQLRAAELAGTDLVELRVDFLPPQAAKMALPQMLQARTRPIITTCRAKWEGGQFDGTEQERLEILMQAAELGSEFVDLELKALEDDANIVNKLKRTSKVILSHHDFETMPSLGQLKEIVTRMDDYGADVAKLAATAHSIVDTATMLSLLRSKQAEPQPKPVIGIAMGEMGIISRLLAQKFGSYLTFSTAADVAREGSAPGQPDIEDLVNIYRIREQTSDSSVFGVIGNPVSQSKSPHIHNAAFRECGKNSVYVPLLVENIESFLDAFSHELFPDFKGFSVTIPHKESAQRVADYPDALSTQIGAANTLLRSETGKLSAMNTDAQAAISSITEQLRSDTLEGKTLVVLGSGGAARALAYGGINQGAGKVVIAGRTVEKAEKLCQEITERTNIPTEALPFRDVSGEREPHQILANTTPIGMVGKGSTLDELPIPRESIRGFEVIFDAVYNPPETALLKEAKRQNIPTASGLDMFIRQAAAQFQLFSDSEAPISTMTQEVYKALGIQSENL